MDYTVEVIIFVIMVLLVSTRPEGLMSIGSTIIGRAMILVLIVCLSLKSTIGGLLGALLLVVVSESILEGMEGENDTKGSESKEDKKGKGGGKTKKNETSHKDTSDCDSDVDDCESNGKGSGSDTATASVQKKEGKAKDAGKPKDEGNSKGTSKEKLKNMIGGTDIVSLTEKFSKLRSLADAINRAQ